MYYTSRIEHANSFLWLSLEIYSEYTMESISLLSPGITLSIRNEIFSKKSKEIHFFTRIHCGKNKTNHTPPVAVVSSYQLSALGTRNKHEFLLTGCFPNLPK